MAARAHPPDRRKTSPHEFPYNRQHDPPAPVLPLRVGAPGADPVVAAPALVDSGADLTVLPEELVRMLRLPQIGEVTVRGVEGVARRVPVYAAEVEVVGGIRRIVEVVGIRANALLGRDVLNGMVITLDGPQQVLRVEGG
jgi:hypothetical protein